MTSHNSGGIQTGVSFVPQSRSQARGLARVMLYFSLKYSATVKVLFPHSLHWNDTSSAFHGSTSIFLCIRFCPFLSFMTWPLLSILLIHCCEKLRMVLTLTASVPSLCFIYFVLTRSKRRKFSRAYQSRVPCRFMSSNTLIAG